MRIPENQIFMLLESQKERRKIKTETKNKFAETIAENLLHFVKGINLQIQETQETQNEVGKNSWSTPYRDTA